MKMLPAVVLTMIAAAPHAGALAQAERSEPSEAQRAAEQAVIAEERAQRAAEADARSAVVEAEAAADRARREAGVAETRTELEAARARLQQARSELELAAQELASLTAEQYRGLGNRFFLDRNFYQMQRPWLGLNISNDEDGVRVVGVSPNGPGALAGVQAGDLIVSIDGLDVSGSGEGNSTRLFLDRLGEVDDGAPVTVAVLRDGEPLELSIVTADRFDTVRLGELSERGNRAVRDVDVHVAPLNAPRGDFTRFRSLFIDGAWNDMELIELTPGLGEYFGTDTGLLVVRAPAGEDTSLREGDVILQIGDRTPQSVGHAMRILASFEPGEALQLTIMREQRQRDIDVAVPTRERSTVRVAPQD